MPEEEIIIQTGDEVSKVDYMRTTNDMLTAHSDEIQNNIDTITEQLDIIMDNTSTSSSVSPDISTDINTLIDNIDTSMVESNTQNILIKLDNQQQQIDDINTKLDLILSKL